MDTPRGSSRLTALALTALVVAGGSARAASAETLSRVAPAWQETLDGVTIPERPAMGRIHGQPFAFEQGTIEDGILKLRQGKELFADLELSVFLFLDKGEIPEGQTFRVDTSEGYGLPHVWLAWKDPGENRPNNESFTHSYAMLLKFGQAQGRQLPGKIYVSLPDEQKSVVAGTFVVEIQGLLLLDGKPDLTHDHPDVLQYLAQQHLEAQYPGQELAELEFGNWQYAHAHPSRTYQEGFGELSYQLGDGPTTVQRFQFVKDPDAWRVLRTLKQSELPQAHPYKVPQPGPKQSPGRLFDYLAASRVEQDVQQDAPGQGIYNARFNTGYSPKVKLGRCEATYQLSKDGPEVTRRFLFRLGSDGWDLDRELQPNERINFKTGTVEQQ